MSAPEPIMRPELLNRYLSLLGIDRRPPSTEALREVVRAHLIQVPFENISKLYFKKHYNLRGLPSLEQYLDGIDRFNFGGTCYANNYYLYLLLESLGYDVKLCGADMSNPDVHLVSMVRIKDREYLVDVGYAAPFLNPMPRDLAADYTITLGRDQYVLKPQDALGRSRMNLYRDGKLRHGYLAKPEPRQIDEFEPAIVASYQDDATFMNALLLARFFPDRSLVIHNLMVIESQGNTATMHTLARSEELGQVIQDNFRIPRKFVDDVLSGLSQLGDAWS